MKKIVINGGRSLSGTVDISTSKNSFLPIMAASILTHETVILNNPPILEDVLVMCKLLESLDKKVDIANGHLSISQNGKIDNAKLDSELVNKMRASFLLMGPMLATKGICKISMPGGCKIGTRPIDLHLNAFKELGTLIDLSDDIIIAKSKKLLGVTIDLKYPSVGATENVLMASTLASGTTIINNAAREPEIIDLANFLNMMGARIEGMGTSRIIIEGVNKLHGVRYTPIPDRIEACTFIVAALITKSKIAISNVRMEDIKSVCQVLKGCGADIYATENGIVVDGNNDLRSANIITGPYPDFPTDVQAQIMSLLSVVNGKSIITETVFENRFLHVKELIKMGADILICSNKAEINGKTKLYGANVKATDLRGGAAIVIAGLIAEGQTEIEDIYHIDRGYVKIEEKLKGLGAKIERCIV